MSAAQAMASQQFLRAMGPMINDEQKVTRVMRLITYMRETEDQLPMITETELENCMPLDEAMSQLRKHIQERFAERIQA